MSINSVKRVVLLYYHLFITLYFAFVLLDIHIPDNSESTNKFVELLFHSCSFHFAYTVFFSNSSANMITLICFVLDERGIPNELNTIQTILRPKFQDFFAEEIILFINFIEKRKVPKNAILVQSQWMSTTCTPTFLKRKELTLYAKHTNPSVRTVGLQRLIPSSGKFFPV